MNREQNPDSDFGQRLRVELKAIVAERAAAEAEASTGTPARRRGLRLALAGAAVAAAATVTLIVGAGGGGTPAAYAIEPQPEGMVNVEIRSLEDAKGLEQALDKAGIRASVTYLAIGMACKEPRFRPAPTTGSIMVLRPVFPRVGPGGQYVPTAFRISRDAVRPGQTLVITASPGPPVAAPLRLPARRRDEAADTPVHTKVAEGSVGPCEPVPAPPNS